jgi:deoxyhypusine synthase
MAERPSGEPGEPLRPRPLEVGMSVTQCVEEAFAATAAAHVRKAAHTLTDEILALPSASLGLSLDVQLLCGGAGVTSLAPLLRGGYVDWVATTGDNLFFDVLHALGRQFHAHVPAGTEDWVECADGISIRAADVRAGEQTLREILTLPDFQRAMGTAEMHALLGGQLRVREKELGVEYPSLLSTAHEAGVPIFNPAPTDNPLGALVAELALLGNRLVIDTSIDLNEAAALLIDTACGQASCAHWSLGDGPAARFSRGLPLHLAAILGRCRCTGYTWGVCVQSGAGAGCVHSLGSGAPAHQIRIAADLTLALPLLTAYILDRVPPRPLRRLGGRRDEFLDRLRQERLQATLKRPLQALGMD